MADQDCRDACVAAYKARVAKLFDILADCMMTAESDDAKKQCKDRFRRGVHAAREARDVCISVCGE